MKERSLYLYHIENQYMYCLMIPNRIENFHILWRY